MKFLLSCLYETTGSSPLDGHRFLLLNLWIFLFFPKRYLCAWIYLFILKSLDYSRFLSFEAPPPLFYCCFHLDSLSLHHCALYSLSKECSFFILFNCSKVSAHAISSKGMIFVVVMSKTECFSDNSFPNVRRSVVFPPPPMTAVIPG